MFRNKHKNNPSINSPEIVRQIVSKNKIKIIFIIQKLLRILQTMNKILLKFVFTFQYKVSDKSDYKKICLQSVGPLNCI